MPLPSFKNSRLCFFALSALVAIVCAAFNYGERDCSRYKQGVFYYYEKHEGKNCKLICTRNGNIENWVCKEINMRAKVSIEWKDDCSYNMRVLSIEGIDKKQVAKAKKRKIVVKIAEGHSRYYTFTMTDLSNNYNETHKMWIQQ